MLSFKNPFAKPEPSTEPPEDSPPTVNEGKSDTLANAVKRWQLERGRTKKRVEELTAELEAARVALPQRERQLGERMVDQLDTTSAAESVKQANDHIRTLEAAVTIATEKDKVAQAQLREAEQGLLSAKQDEARDSLVVLTLEAEELFARIKSLRSELVREANAAFAIGAIQSWGNREILDYWDFFLRLANRSAGADLADSGAFRKFPSWTHAVMYACGRIKP